MSVFTKGARVRLSAEGRTALSDETKRWVNRWTERQGTVTYPAYMTTGGNVCAPVCWDGNKGVDLFAVDFLELVPSEVKP